MHVLNDPLSTLPDSVADVALAPGMFHSYSTRSIHTFTVLDTTCTYIVASLDLKIFKGVDIKAMNGRSGSMSSGGP